jgi:exopolysaccharide production protein ExoZ
MPERTANPRLSAIDGLRGYAVTLTFLVHFAAIFAERRLGFNVAVEPYAHHDAVSLFVSWLYLSQHGVYLFFVLSGLLIWGKLKRESNGLGGFLAGRVLRIMPAALASLLLAAWVIVLLGQPAPTFADWLMNLLFLNGIMELQVRHINHATWSLFYEWVFYLSAPLIYRLSSQMRNPSVTAATAGAGIALALSAFQPLYGAYIALFIAGCVVADHTSSSPQSLTRDLCLIALYAAYVSMVGTVIALPGPGPVPGTFTVNPAYAAYVAGFGVLGAILVRRARSPSGLLGAILSVRPLTRLGRISYSLFLFHLPVLWLYYGTSMAKFASVTQGALQLLVDFAATFTVAILLAHASFRLLERPYFRSYSHTSS